MLKAHSVAAKACSGGRFYLYALAAAGRAGVERALKNLSPQLRKAVIASTVGTAIEWYDFFLCGTAAGLYFPNQEPLAATLAA